jgi:hypothetical protein
VSSRGKNNQPHINSTSSDSDEADAKEPKSDAGEEPTKKTTPPKVTGFVEKMSQGIGEPLCRTCSVHTTVAGCAHTSEYVL